MLKNQRGEVTLILIILITISFYTFLMVHWGIERGQKEALGTPIQFKELEKNVSYTLLERLPSSNNLSIIRQMENSSEEFSQKVVVGLHPGIKTHDKFILKEDNIYIEEKKE